MVAEAADGQQGVAAILRTAPDLVLLDLELPGVDGFTVIDLIRTSGMKPRILVFSSFYDEYSVYRIERAKVQQRPVQGRAERPDMASLQAYTI